MSGECKQQQENRVKRHKEHKKTKKEKSGVSALTEVTSSFRKVENDSVRPSEVTEFFNLIQKGL